MRTLIVLLIATICRGPLPAQEIGPVQRSAIIESIGGKEYYIHLVRQGQTMETISRAYEVSIDELNIENPRLKGVVREGDVLKIPTKPAGISPEKNVTPEFSEPKTEIKALTKENIHIVAAGETFFGISRQYGISVSDLQQANPGIASLQTGQNIIIPEKHAGEQINEVQAQDREKKTPEHFPSTYTVETGETLYSISRKFSVTVDELRKLNPELSEGLKAGQVIRLKPSDTDNTKHYITLQDTTLSFTYHRVRRGETVYGIARRYGILVADIMKYNPQAAQGIQPRHVLQIPVFTVKEKKVEQEIPKEPEQVIHYEPDEPDVPAGCAGKPLQGKTYNIALLIPFFLDSQEAFIPVDTTRTVQSNANKPFEFMQFYYGAMLAIDSLGKLGLNARVNVFDVDNTPESVTKLLARTELSRMDLIIGPLYGAGFERVARFARDNKIKIINPLSTRNDFLQNNPYTFKAQSSAAGQIELIAKYIAQNRSNSNIIVVRQFSFSETGAIELFRKEFSGSNLHEVIYLRDSLNGILRHLRKDRDNIVVGLSTDKVFTIDLIRKINDIRIDYPITCFGLQEWEDFALETDYMVNLNLHLPSYNFIDFQSEQTINFIRSFRSKYNTEPLHNRFAFAAFDVTFYFLSALMKYGKDFEECLPWFRHRGLQIPFEFSSSGRNGMENKGLTIYMVQNFRRIQVYPEPR